MEYLATIDRQRAAGLIPHVPHAKQQSLLLLGDVPEALYGGAAGGGKSDALLMAAAQYLHVPGYSALLLRRTFPDLMQPNALIPRAKRWWFGRPGVAWSAANKRFTFACPGGGHSTVTFGYLEKDDHITQYQGAEYQFIGIDELTQHSREAYLFLFSRLRKPSTGPLAAVPLRMRAGTNPGGRGHEWVKKRFIDPRTRHPGAAFVPARLEDNPSLDREAYTRSLSFLDPVTRSQLLAGDWDAVEGGRFRAEWFGRYAWEAGFVVYPGQRFDPSRRPRFLTADTAASSKRTADYTVVAVWCLSPDAKLVLLDLKRFRAEVPEILDRIKGVVREWHPAFVGIEEVGAHSGKAIGQLLRRATDPPMTIRSLTPKSQDKLVRATAAITLAHDGRFLLPEGLPGLDDALAELVRFTGIDDSNDDVVDAFSYAAELLPTVTSGTSAPLPKATGGVAGPVGPARPAAVGSRPAGPRPGVAGVGGVRW